MGERSARLFRDEIGTVLVGEPKKAGAEIATALGPVNADGVWQCQ
jgi:hypothetical protein